MAVGTLVVVLTVVLAIAAFRGSRAQAALRAQYPPPGEMVDVGGYRLHLNCQGIGSPTVVLVAGGGDFSLSWSVVQPEVARTTRVCAYDPPGMGWSELGPEPPTMANLVEELHTLLERGGVEGPYVLVGHSLGGLYVRAYAGRYPEEVVGMVLVDSSHEDQGERVADALAAREGRRPGTSLTDKINTAAQTALLALFEAQESAGILAMYPQAFPDAGLPPMPDDVKTIYKSVILASDTYWEAYRRQATHTEAHMTELREMHLTSLDAMPLVVLSVKKREVPPGFALSAEEVAAMQTQMHAELAAMSSQGELVVVDDTSHFIQFDQPQVVIDAILRVVRER